MNSFERSPGAEANLEVHDVRERFGSTRALKGVSFRVGRGSVHALLGGNGSGKSTLVKILAGVERADGGEVTIAGQRLRAAELTPLKAAEAQLRFVHQSTSTFGSLSVEENLAIGHGFETRGPWISWREQRRHAREVLERFELHVSPRAELGSLSPAMQTMVAIARALQDVEERATSILILDEPTAALPHGEVALLLDSLRRRAEAGQTILMVTHRLEEVCEIADSATVLRDGLVAAELKREEISHESLVEAIVGSSLATAEKRGARQASPTSLLEVKGLVGGAIREATFSVSSGEIVGIAGLLGSGRSSLLKILFGMTQPRAGAVTLSGSAYRPRSPREAMSRGVGMTPGDRSGEAAFGPLTLRENLSMATLPHYARWGFIRGRADRRHAREAISAYGIVAATTDIPFAALSGGNQQKAVMARAIEVGTELLLLDEPTQGVDVGARRDIWEQVRRAVDGGASALVVSSDLEELSAISDRAIVMVQGRVIAELDQGEVSEANLDRLVITSEP